MHLHELTDQMADRLKELEAVYANRTILRDPDGHKFLASIHFFSKIDVTIEQAKILGFNVGFVRDSKLCVEVAYFCPSMHSPLLGPLSGFSEINRLNGVDVTNLSKIIY